MSLLQIYPCPGVPFIVVLPEERPGITVVIDHARTPDLTECTGNETAMYRRRFTPGDRSTVICQLSASGVPGSGKNQ